MIVKGLNNEIKDLLGEPIMFPHIKEQGKQGISAQMLGNGYSDNAAIGFACQVLNCSLKTI